MLRETITAIAFLGMLPRAHMMMICWKTNVKPRGGGSTDDV